MARKMSRAAAVATAEKVIAASRAAGEHVVVRHDERLKDALRARSESAVGLQRGADGQSVVGLWFAGEGWRAFMEGHAVAPSKSYPYAA